MIGCQDVLMIVRANAFAGGSGEDFFAIDNGGDFKLLTCKLLQGFFEELSVFCSRCIGIYRFVLRYWN